MTPGQLIRWLRAQLPQGQRGHDPRPVAKKAADVAAYLGWTA